MIDLWEVPLDGDASAESRALALLDAAERAEYRGFGTAALARAFALRRAARRVILARYLGLRPGAVVFGREAGGRPVVAGLWFNASSAGGRAVLAVTRAGPVGVDVERLRRLDERLLLRHVLAPGERAWIAPLSGEARVLALLEAWTAKEAVLKAAGGGLEIDALARIDTPPAGAGWGRAASPWGTWHVRCFRGEGQVISLAARTPAGVTRRDAGAALREHGLA